MASKKELTNGKYVDDQMGNGIPEGGRVGQVLKKISDADYDVNWENSNTLPKNNRISLSFNWTKEQIVTKLVVPGGVEYIYFKLGIDFNGINLHNGATYTLLIDRFRSQSKLGAKYPDKRRKSSYKHELQIDAQDNHRINEIEITSEKGQYFDFNQGEYFKRTTNVNPLLIQLSGAKGTSPNKRSTRDQPKIYFVNLSFRIRIKENGIITETGSLGKISLSCNPVRDTDAVPKNIISYARPSS
jgi:hypothetical protein